MRFGSLPEPYVPQVKVPDMGAINTNALAGAVNMGRIQEMGYERGARNAYDNALAGGASEMDAVGSMRQQGYGSQAGKVQDNVLARQSRQADMAGKLDEFIRQRSPLAQSQDDWNLVLDEAVGRFGLNPGAIPQTLKAWTPDLGKKLALGGLSAAQQVELEFKKSEEVRRQAEEGRKTQLFPGQIAAQGAALSHAQGAEQRAQDKHPLEMQNLGNKGQKVIMVPGPDGFTKVPHVYDATTGEAHPVQVSEGGGRFSGQIEAGNIDLNNRPKVKNADGSISTVRSMSVNIGGQEILLPTVSDDGRNLTEDQAVEQYRRTGKHLGKFSSPEAATAYAEKLHQDQERQYVGTQGGKSPYKEYPDAKQAKDGKWYVQKDGKTFRVGD